MSNIIATGAIDALRACGIDMTLAALLVSTVAGFSGSFFIFAMALVPPGADPGGVAPNATSTSLNSLLGELILFTPLHFIRILLTI